MERFIIDSNKTKLKTFASALFSALLLSSGCGMTLNTQATLDDGSSATLTDGTADGTGDSAPASASNTSV